MKAKILYEKRSESYGRVDSKETLVVHDGKYYKLMYGGNCDYSYARIVDAEPTEELPEEYVKEDGRTRSSLKYGEDKEVEIPLTDFGTYYWEERPFPESLVAEYRHEYEELQREKIKKSIEKNPELDYQKSIESMSLSDQEKKVALEIMSKMEGELLTDHRLELEDYKDIIVNLERIAKGKAVIVTHKKAHYYRPEDDLVDLNNLDFYYLAEADEYRPVKPGVYSLDKKSIKLQDGTTYYGSWGGAYVIDLMTNPEGIPYIRRNVVESHINDQFWKSKVDTSLPFNRFSNETGKESDFEEYNQKVRDAKKSRYEFFRGVIDGAKEKYGLTEEQARSLLEFSGSVTALSFALELEDNNLTTDQALAMLRKNSHAGMRKVLDEAHVDYPKYTFDMIQDAARTLAYADYLGIRPDDSKGRLSELRDELESAKKRINNENIDE